MPEEPLKNQIGFYAENGYLLIGNRVPSSVLDQIRAQIERFKGLAFGMEASEDKFDLEDSHRPDAPRIRSLKLPHTQPELVRDLMLSDHILATVRELIGPNLRLKTTKLNMISAGFGAAVEWHQDWAFYPCTNDDVLTVGLIIGDMGPEKGPLMVFPGTHKQGVFNHHHNGYFAGAMNLEASGLDLADAVPLIGPAGRISIHNARIVHGSALSQSKQDRRIIFYEMLAANAFPLFGGDATRVSLGEFDERMLCGDSTLEPRMIDAPVRIPLPLPPTTGSIYEVQNAMGKRSFGVAK